MLEICAIASGSNGNCYYIGNQNSAILIDAGISTKQILLRMAERQLDPEKIKALFITHEHSDHLRGARVLAKRLQIPVYITAKTFNKAYKNMRPDYPRFFSPEEEIEIDDFTIFPVLKNHDAAEPCSFRIQYKAQSIGVFTDIGESCDKVKHHFAQCDGVFLEANYDEEMLWNGHYPWHLKKRVASELGHLSNDQAFRLLKEHASDSLQCVFLSHVSKDNNTPEMALKAMQTLAHKFEIEVAPRYEAGSVYRFS